MSLVNSGTVPGPNDADAGFVVGFDLDMTLIDGRVGIARAFRALSAETGVFVDADLVVSRLGPPLEQELAEWFPREDIPAVAKRYREFYGELAITSTVALPGAHEALAAVRRHGGRSIVVTAKNQPQARLHIDHLALEVDEVVGGLWSDGKAAALREHGASVYVGDHLGDVRGARAADAVSVAVATGPISAADLAAAGADAVLADLTAFPAWLDTYRKATTG
ncbi:HAD family hydrolase [Yinghuangia seranimata]|uniref:HAD family hydrolase n=1 Tax=Yinghuangia seranimata TaxID=408067 RepID=UPI00248AC39B|nr:HAD hydrolase-like protein [Yinghuangia seranimata]MDI2126601.1 haloacid dehalogenase-like hydrolase [Yinghuangia seranimata]